MVARKGWRCPENVTSAKVIIKETQEFCDIDGTKAGISEKVFEDLPSQEEIPSPQGRC